MFLRVIMIEFGLAKGKVISFPIIVLVCYFFLVEVVGLDVI